MPDDLDFWSDDDWGGDDSGFDPPPDWRDELSEDQRNMLAALYGEGNESQVVVNIRDVSDPSAIRAIRFTSVVDALQYLFEIVGSFSFSIVVEVEPELYAVLIDDDTP